MFEQGNYFLDDEEAEMGTPTSISSKQFAAQLEADEMFWQLEGLERPRSDPSRL